MLQIPLLTVSRPGDFGPRIDGPRIDGPRIGLGEDSLSFHALGSEF